MSSNVKRTASRSSQGAERIQLPSKICSCGCNCFYVQLGPLYLCWKPHPSGLYSLFTAHPGFDGEVLGLGLNIHDVHSRVEQYLRMNARRAEEQMKKDSDFLKQISA